MEGKRSGQEWHRVDTNTNSVTWPDRAGPQSKYVYIDDNNNDYYDFFPKSSSPLTSLSVPYNSSAAAASLRPLDVPSCGTKAREMALPFLPPLLCI